MTGDAADIQNLRSYYTEGQAFFRSTEASNLNSYYTWRRTLRGDIRYRIFIFAPNVIHGSKIHVESGEISVTLELGAK